ncbi:PREDICTED: uncharacterized protein LOC109347054 [Lupinus angustifolius]|uniref:uncharacterized protein LOC109347054 n=1 Tax=Lupinus angustifolius TaxID=3871 RepID=UPI00092F5906|nr:PREDICTED: uncharacterized protein LOC109347054 [Lupinus angustifolius]
MEIARTSKGIFLYYRKYTTDLLKEVGMLVAKPCSTPMEYSGKLINSQSGIPLQDASSYQRLMGKLLYLTYTRPNLCFSFGHLRKFLSQPTNQHLSATMAVLRYLKSSITYGVFFSAKSKLNIKDYVDVGWATYIDTRKFVSSYCFFLGDSLGSWKSKKQQIVSRSSVEVEYRVMALAACEAQWQVSLLQELGISHSHIVQLFCDNQSTMHVVVNPVFQE